MPEWSDTALILERRPHGESNAVVTVLSQSYGRHAGLVHAAASRSKKGMLELGNLVATDWQARLEGQLGTFRMELERSAPAACLDAPLKLAAIASCCALINAGIPEREPHSNLFDATIALLEIISLSEDDDTWLAYYIRWEAGLLTILGFGLELGRCAVSGTADELIYVSPRSGCAVGRASVGAFADRMLVLPALLGGAVVTNTEISSGLSLTGHFLGRRVFQLIHQDLPTPRWRLAHLVSRRYNNDIIS